VNVTTLPAIASRNGSSDKIHNSLTDMEAYNVAGDLLPLLAGQADALRLFFANSTSTSGTMTATFAALRSFEAAIENKANQTTGLLTYHTTVDAQRGLILDKIFENDAAGRITFDKYFDAYKKGQYLISADWDTGTRLGGLTIGAAEQAYRDARDLISITHDAGTYIGGGRTSSLNIGSDADVHNGQFVQLMTAMKTQIVNALGLTGVTNADKMAEALIIQLGQDNEEFRAFIDDLGAEGLTNALSPGHDYSTGAFVVASAGMQSGPKLAAVNPDTTFDPEEFRRKLRICG
jgi:hypothetical protein